MAQLAALAGQQALSIARQHKIASRGLAALGKRAKNRWVKGLLNGGSTVAAALGFGRSLGTGLPQPSQRGGGGNRKKNQNRASRAGVSLVSGASTVGAGNAPVAFARTDDLKPIFRIMPSNTPDSCLIHAVEYVTQPTFNASAGVFGVPLFAKLGPQSTTLHPWLSNMAPLFQRYRLKFLRIHYQHFAPTSAQGQILVQYFPDPSYNNSASTGLTQAIVSECGNFMTGSCYEDFCHTADLSGLDKTQWFDTQTTSPTDDVNANWCGIISVATMNQTASLAPTGNIWIEAVYEMNGRSMSAVTVGLSELRTVVQSKLQVEDKLRLAAAVVTKVITDNEDNARKKRDAVRSTPISEIEEKYFGKGKDRTSWPSSAALKVA